MSYCMWQRGIIKNVYFMDPSKFHVIIKSDINGKWRQLWNIVVTLPPPEQVHMRPGVHNARQAAVRRIVHTLSQKVALHIFTIINSVKNYCTYFFLQNMDKLSYLFTIKVVYVTSFNNICFFKIYLYVTNTQL